MITKKQRYWFILLSEDIKKIKKTAKKDYGRCLIELDQFKNDRIRNPRHLHLEKIGGL